VLPNDYISGLLQHITSSVCLGYFDDTLQGIYLGVAYIEEHKLNQSANFRALMFAYHATYRIIVHNYMGEKRRILDTIKQTLPQLSLHEHALSFELKQIIYGNLMNTYMAAGDLEQAEAVWDNLFNKQSKTVWLDIYADLFLFRLFLLLHTKNYSLLLPAAQAAERFYRKNEQPKQQFEVELPIALLLQKDRDYRDPEVLKQVMAEASGFVQKFIGNLPGLNNFQEHYTRYIIWCDAIEHDEPYYEAARRWYKGYVASSSN